MVECRAVHLLDVLLDHAARAEAARDRPDPFPHDLQPSLRDVLLITLVERRDHLFLEQSVQRLGIGFIGRVRVIAEGGPMNQPAVPPGVAFSPPAVPDAQVGDTVQRRLHAARATGLERFPWVVQPDVTALHDKVRHMQVVVVDERDPPSQRRVERSLIDALQVALPDIIRWVRLCPRTRSGPANVAR